MNKESARMVAVALCCACGVACLALGADDAARTQGWRQLLLSPDERDRDRAARMVMEERKADVSALLQIVAMPVQPDEPFLRYQTPRNIAIRLLGELRAEEAIEPLITWLTPKPGMSGDVTELGPIPAARALQQIGMPAAPALMEVLATAGVAAERGAAVAPAPAGPPEPTGQGHGHLADECLRVLVWIKGLEEAEVGLRRAITEEMDAARKRNLQGALFALSRPRLRESFQGFLKHEEDVERAKWHGWWAKHVEEEAKREAAPPQPEKAQAEQAQPEAAPPEKPGK